MGAGKPFLPRDGLTTMSVLQFFRRRAPSQCAFPLLAFLAILSVLSCGGAADIIPPPTPTVAQVIIAPSSATLMIGTTQSFSAEVRSSVNTVMSGQTVVWAVSDTAVVSVSKGVVTAKKVGSATVIGAVGIFQGMATVTVVVPVAP